MMGIHRGALMRLMPYGGAANVLTYGYGTEISIVKQWRCKKNRPAGQNILPCRAE